MNNTQIPQTYESDVFSQAIQAIDYNPEITTPESAEIFARTLRHLDRYGYGHGRTTLSYELATGEKFENGTAFGLFGLILANEPVIVVSVYDPHFDITYTIQPDPAWNVSNVRVEPLA